MLFLGFKRRVIKTSVHAYAYVSNVNSVIIDDNFIIRMQLYLCGNSSDIAIITDIRK